MKIILKLSALVFIVISCSVIAGNSPPPTCNPFPECDIERQLSLSVPKPNPKPVKCKEGYKYDRRYGCIKDNARIAKLERKKPKPKTPPTDNWPKTEAECKKIRGAKWTTFGCEVPAV